MTKAIEPGEIYHYHHDGIPDPLSCPGCAEELRIERGALGNIFLKHLERIEEDMLNSTVKSTRDYWREKVAKRNKSAD